MVEFGGQNVIASDARTLPRAYPLLCAVRISTRACISIDL